MAKLNFIIIISVLLFISCNNSQQNISTPKETVQKLHQFYDKVFEGEVSRSPELETRLGRKENYGRWNDYSKTYHDLEVTFAKNILSTLKDSFNIEGISKEEDLNYRLFKNKYERLIEGASFYKFKFWVNQMHGIQSEIPAFLINKHKIGNTSDANNYVQRLEIIPTLLSQVQANLKRSAKEDIIVPQFVFEHVLNDSKNIIKGFPLDKNKNNTLYNDFLTKIEKLGLNKIKKDQLIEDFKIGLIKMANGYQTFIDFLEELKEKAPTNDGLWQYDGGDKYYQYTLKKHTTTDFTAEEIHQLGLSEVTRIHNEMKKIISQIEFKGDLKSFFTFMKNDPQFYYPSTPQGKKDYIVKAESIISELKIKLPQLFTIFPKADIKVKSVEAFREKSAGKAFYEDPAPDGSRPGTFYVNTYNMKSIPIYQLEALAYHEGIPGHHMQIAIAQENEKLPKFRKYASSYTAYIEGWALYSETFPKEYGFYTDPYSDFGRLAMELWRACRLVVDTGIHAKKWTRQEGIDYYLNNTPNDIGDCVKMVERHIVMPGQATSYKMGMLKIMAFRKMAKQKLGEKFDIKTFHDVVLSTGPVPLNILEENVNNWIDSIK